MSVQDRDSYSNCPAGWHAYELRTSDCDDGQICSIERRVVVNWWGCFFTQQEINLSDKCAKVVSQNFLDKSKETFTLATRYAWKTKKN